MMELFLKSFRYFFRNNDELVKVETFLILNVLLLPGSFTFRIETSVLDR